MGSVLNAIEDPSLESFLIVNLGTKIELVLIEFAENMAFIAI